MNQISTSPLMMRVSIGALLVSAAILFAPAWPSAFKSTQTGVAIPVVSGARAPAGTEDLAVTWIKIAPPGLGTMLAAVARPTGAGPLPTVILLHGTHGFARQYVQLALDLSRGGLLAIAPCWFSGGSGVGSRFVTPIACPDAPPMPAAASPEAMRIVDALVQATRAVSDARADRVALFGHSRGAGATLNYVLGTGHANAAVLNSGGYPHELSDRISHVKYRS